jgi:hypothetical protein
VVLKCRRRLGGKGPQSYSSAKDELIGTENDHVDFLNDTVVNLLPRLRVYIDAKDSSVIFQNWSELIKASQVSVRVFFSCSYKSALACIALIRTIHMYLTILIRKLEILESFHDEALMLALAMKCSVGTK